MFRRQASGRPQPPLALLLTLLLTLLNCLWTGGYAQFDDTTTQAENLIVTSPGNTTSNQSVLCRPIPMDHPCYGVLGQNYHLSNLSLRADLTVKTINIGFTLLKTLNPPPPTVCISSMRHITCFIATPPCNTDTGLLLNFCQDSCKAHNRLLNDELCVPVLKFFEDFRAQSKQLELVTAIDLLFSFRCNDKSSCDNSLLDTTQCADLFNPGETEQILSKPNQCMNYPSPLCESMAGSTGHYVYIRDRKNDTYIHNLLTSFKSTNYTCSDIVLNVACYYEYPPCDPTTGNAIPLCPESCDAFSALVDPCLSLLDPDDHFGMRLRGINCSNVTSYLEPFLLIDNSTCINSSNEESGVTAEVTIGVLVLLALVSIILLTLILIFYKKRRNFHSRRLQNCRQRARTETTNYREANERFYSLQPSKDRAVENLNETPVILKAIRKSYEKAFSSILVPFASFTVGEEIGQGAFGKVYRGEMLKIGLDSKKKEVAIKTIKNLNSHDEVEAFFSESFIMKDFEHPNVLGLCGICFDTPDEIPYILLPYMVNGSLKDFLKRKRIHVTNVDTLPEDLKISVLVKMCLEVAQGMQYLAGRKFVHRDLAARNCMVNTNLTIKVGDFGLARDIYSADYYRSGGNGIVPVKWMPPETLHDRISNEKTDIWSYGVTCWEVFSLGRTPYPGIQNQDMLKHIANGDRLDRPTLCPKTMYDIIMCKCWELKPEDRPSFNHLVHQLLEYWEDKHAYVVESSSQ